MTHQAMDLSALADAVASRCAALLSAEGLAAFRTTVLASEGVPGEAGGRGAVRLTLASDELSLDDKITLEAKLLAGLGGVFDGVGLQINFRRQTPRAAAPGPAPTAPESTTSAGGGAAGHAGRRAGVGGAGSVQKRRIPGVGRVLVVGSGKGGVGKSTVSANLAAALALDATPVGLLDADIYGPSLPTLFNLTGPLTVNGEQKIVPISKYGVRCVSFGFLSEPQSAVVWRGPMIARAVEQLCFDVDWSGVEYLVIDLPPGTGDVQLTLMEKVELDGALLVCTPQDVALADAHRALSMFERMRVPVLGMVENMAYYQCHHCSERSRPFGDGVRRFASERKVRVLGELPLSPDLAAASDAGIPHALDAASQTGTAFRFIAQEVVAQLNAGVAN